jgi:hypothetical protein
MDGIELRNRLIEYRVGLNTFTEHQCLIKNTVKLAQRTGSPMAPPMQLFIAKNALVLKSFQKKIKYVKKQLHKYNLERRGLNVVPSK